MTEASRTRDVAARPAAVWAVLADFGSLSTWADGVDHSCLLNDRAAEVGLTRRVQSGRDTFVETITAFDPPQLLTYDIHGVPRGFSASNRWNLHARGDRATTVTLTSTVTMNSRLLRPIGERVFAQLMTRRSEALLSSLAFTLGGRS
ncbi:SRPBCC family protein [Mycobacterium sp. 236(2023)]|uniref:SRPBCC family protein n=1 Tax=Mycobacterium sp. 236(2023) TaxID=3038163 RepID=UPI002414EEE6|nr:SRPBCC family protein [Mycobacterium sp. 236(2023)]MDG4668605.1 SRPBCC family protein [Mycobacterium sp. 236(2023)]